MPRRRATSAQPPLPPIVVIEDPDAPISPRQRAAWWHVAARLQRRERHKIAQQGGTPDTQQAPPQDPTP